MFCSRVGFINLQSICQRLKHGSRSFKESTIMIHDSQKTSEPIYIDWFGKIVYDADVTWQGRYGIWIYSVSQKFN